MDRIPESEYWRHIEFRTNIKQKRDQKVTSLDSTVNVNKYSMNPITNKGHKNLQRCTNITMWYKFLPYMLIQTNQQ